MPEAISMLSAASCTNVLQARPTFDGDSFYDMVRLHLNETPSRLPFFQPGVSHPKELVEIIFTALKKILTIVIKAQKKCLRP
jgi:hypothetical protein